MNGNQVDKIQAKLIDLLRNDFGNNVTAQDITNSLAESLKNQQLKEALVKVGVKEVTPDMINTMVKLINGG